MATIDRRAGKRGGVTWRVRWRTGGLREGASDGETCDHLQVAKKFKALVEAAGQRRPEGYPKGCRGLKLAPAEPELPVTTDRTFGEVVEEYLANGPAAEERQVALYRRNFDLHVRAAVVKLKDGTKVGPLGGIPARDITKDVIEAWASWMAKRTYLYKGVKRQYSPKTIHNIHGAVISPAMGYATEKGYVTISPCVKPKLPKKPSKGVTGAQVPTGEEIQLWIRTAYDVATLAGDIITVAFGTGLRWSEIIALRPCDIDLKRALLTVSQAVKEDAKRRHYVAPYGKSDKALRTIRIPSTPAVVRDLADGGRSGDGCGHLLIMGGCVDCPRS